MTVTIFVIMLSIAIFFVIKRNIAIVLLAAIWGFFLGMTPAGPTIAHILNGAGVAFVGMIS